MERAVTRYSRCPYLFLSLAIFLMIGCLNAEEDEGTGPQQDKGLEIKVGTEFQLRPGQTASIEPEGMLIKFLKVTNDSRCRSDVVCVWAGQVEVLINISIGNKSFDVNLIKGPDENLSKREIDGYVIKLIQVDPYPVSTKEPDPSEYLITLVVDKAI